VEVVVVEVEVVEVAGVMEVEGEAAVVSNPTYCLLCLRWMSS
jgi:hypothetical protein